MEIEKQKTFVRASMLFALSRKLNLTNEQLRNLFRECILVAGSLQDIPTQQVACIALADINVKLSQFDKAIELYNSIFSHLMQTGSKTAAIYAYNGIGNCYRSLEEYDKAINHHEMCLNIAKQIGDKEEERRAYGNLGNCYYSLGKYNKAIHHYEMCMNIAKPIGNKEGEGGAYGNLGNCYFSLGQYEKAIKHYEMHLNIAKQIGDKAGEGGAYGDLGICYHSLRQYDKAINHHQMHLNIAKQIGDKAGEGGACGNLGTCYFSLGQYDKAINHHEMHLNIAKQIGDNAGGVAHGDLGCCYHALGQYDKAIYHHQMHLNIAKQIGDKAEERRAYGNLGTCYFSLGQYDKAINHHEMHLNIAKQFGDKAGEGVAYSDLGCCYHSLRQYDKAINHHQMHLNIAKQIGDKAGEGRAYSNLGTYYFSLGQCDKAINHHEMHLNIAKQIGDKEGEGGAYGNLGKCYDSLGQHDKAIEQYEMSLNITSQIGNKLYEGTLYNNIGIYYNVLGQYDKAEFNLKKCLQCFEKIYENTPRLDEMKISFRDTFAKCYKTLIKVLVRQEKTNEALFVAERGRARALAELMFSSYFVECTESVRDNILDLDGIHEVVRSMRSTVLFLTLTAYGFYAWIIQRNGCIAVSAQTKDHSSNDGFIPLTERRINTLISKFRESCSNGKCEDRSLAFFYSETESEQVEKEMPSSLLSPIVFPKSEFSSSLAHFGEKSESNGITMTTSAVGTDYRNIEEQLERRENDVLKEFYQTILGPVRHLVEGSQLVIVPEGSLHLVPFSALIDERGRYVAESLQVRLVPSLTTAKMIIENQLEPDGQGTPLIVGDPDVGPKSRLPGANKEARMVGELFNTKPLTGKKATKERFLRSIENANLIHIAAHGNMEKGEILLAPNPVDTNNTTKPKREDMMLTMSDLENKRLKAKLVVLSCCHSARGEVRAEGVVGIARAFLGAGARSVIVALWALEDEATLYFMRKFYEHLSYGERAGKSLNKAMAAMRAHAQYNDPQFWAPFVLIGDDVTVC